MYKGKRYKQSTWEVIKDIMLALLVGALVIIGVCLLFCIGTLLLPFILTFLVGWLVLTIIKLIFK